MSTRYRSAALNRPGSIFPRRKAWLLERLAAADGVTYDELCRGVIGEFPQDGRRQLASVCGVRAVRDLLWDELATTEPDESVWLTASGWAELESLMASAGW
jgi:hypothetical protein